MKNPMTWPTGSRNPPQLDLPGSSSCATNSTPTTLLQQLDPNFADFLNSLNAHGVEYLVIGGYAVGYHGFVRATGDLDIFVRRSQPNVENLLTAFKDFGCDSPELTTNLLLEAGRIVRLGVPPLRLEVMNEISGVSFDQCYPHRVEETIAGVKVNFMDLENLLRNKQAAARPKDLSDVAALSHRSKTS